MKRKLVVTVLVALSAVAGVSSPAAASCDRLLCAVKTDACAGEEPPECGVCIRDFVEPDICTLDAVKFLK